MPTRRGRSPPDAAYPPKGVVVPDLRGGLVSTYPLTADALGSVLSDLTARLGNRVVGPRATGWDEARRAWNLSVDQRPVAVATPESPDDIVDVIEVARDHGLRVAP